MDSGRIGLPPFVSPPPLLGADCAPPGQRPLVDSAPLPAEGVPTPAPPASGALPAGAERARSGAAPRHQVRKRRGPQGAQSGQIGFLIPLAKLEKTVRAGTERYKL